MIANSASARPTDVARSSPARWTLWSDQDAAAFGRRPLRARHRLQESELFSDHNLLALIDAYPRDRMQAFTMGTDLLKREEWKPVEIGTLSARDIIAAVTKGRIWFKLLQVHAVDPRFRTLLSELYGELETQIRGFKPVRTYATLLISSPTAIVYYHADPQPNLLWHIRGEKNVTVYPAGDRELIPQDLMEDIFASWVDEEAPYDPKFERKGMDFPLRPGEVISWPQNGPHRVTNVAGLNISLSTLHETEESDRRALVYCANRLLHRKYRIPARSTRETGVASYAKRTVFRACRRFALVETPPRRAYITDLVLDPQSPDGLRTSDSGPVLTEFSKRDFVLRTAANGSRFAELKSR